jgi:hypothetical protein
MSQPSTTARCPRCGRDIELDEAGRLRGHWDTANYSTEECGGSEQDPTGWPAFPPEPERMPWWAEHVLRELSGLRADHRSARRLAKATRDALAALDQLDAPRTNGEP